MLEALLGAGMKPVADIEGFRNPASGLTATPPEARGQCEEWPTEYTRHGATTFLVHGYHAMWIALYNRLTIPTFSMVSPRCAASPARPA